MSDQRIPKLISVAVVEHKDQFLVGVREQGTAIAGYSEFPGGKVETGESPAECAVRECREETGIDVKAVRLMQDILFKYPHGLLHIHFFLCELIDTDISLAASLKGTFRWVARSELRTLQFLPANDEILRMLQSGIG